MRRLSIPLLVFVAALAVPSAAAAASGRFSVTQIDGVWWFLDPDGQPFFSNAVGGLRPEGDYAPALGRYEYHENILARWGSEVAWADEVLTRCAALKINSMGAWSQPAAFPGQLPWSTVLEFARHAPAVPGVAAGLTGKLVRDYYDPAFAAGAAGEAALALPCAADPLCYGVYSDNELGWGYGVAQFVPYIDAYLLLPAGAPGKLALQAFFEQRYAGDIAAFNAAWSQTLAGFADLQSLTALSANFRADPPAPQADRQAFSAVVAGRYYQTVHDALRAAAPDVLILGSRFLAYHLSAAVAAAAAPWVDVLSVNYYTLAPGFLPIAQSLAAEFGYLDPSVPFGDVDGIYRAGGKPLLITEFSMRAADAGLPNTLPPFFPIEATQAARAAAYGRYAHGALARPFIVGLHWFKWSDQPATGRPDGENSNWGVVDVNDDLYPLLAAQMTAVGADSRVRALAGGGGAAPADCMVEWAVSGRPVSDVHATRFTCVEGDPDCDLDGVSSACVFEILPCLGVMDGRLAACSAARPLTVRIDKPRASRDPILHAALTAQFAELLGAPGGPACGRALRITVPLPGTRHRARTAVRILAQSGPRRDRDRLRLVCERP